MALFHCQFLSLCTFAYLSGAYFVYKMFTEIGKQNKGEKIKSETGKKMK